MKKKAAATVSMALCFALAMGGSLTACNGGGKEDFKWEGLTNVTIAAGDNYDVAEGVSVTYKGTDISSSITVLTLDENEKELTDLGVYEEFEDFNSDITGAYTVYYKATSGDKYDIQKREITVTQQHNVANGSFNETNNDGFYNWTLDQPGGTAAFSKVTENGKQKPKFEVSKLGNAWWSLQYISKANLKQGETYKITVRAKSSNGKSMAFGFEDAANGYAMLKGLSAYTVGKEFNDYVSYYTANKDYTNVKAVLYLGYILEEDPAAAYDITLDSIKIEKVEKCPNVVFTGLDDLTFKGGFDDLKAFIANPKEGVTAKQDETDLTSKIKVLGEVALNPMEGNNFQLAYVVENENGPDAIAFRNVKVNLAKDHPYELINGDFAKDINFWTVDINAENPGPKGATMEWAEGDAKEGVMKITINDPGKGDAWRIQTYQNVNVEKGVHYIAKLRMKADRNRTVQLEIGTPQATLNLTTEYKEYEVAYIAPSTAGVRFNIQMGGGGVDNKGSVIYVDSAEMTLDEDQTNYEPFEMVNAEFDYGMKNWGSEGPATFEAGKDGEDGYVAAKITDNTNAGWHIQLRQDGKTFEQGKTYKLILKAKSTVARNVTVEIRKDNYAGNKAHDFALTTELQTLEYEFSFDDDGATNLRVGMLLGGQFKDSTVSIYQFQIVEVTAE